MRGYIYFLLAYTIRNRRRHSIGIKIGFSRYPFERANSIARELKRRDRLLIDTKLVAMIPGTHFDEPRIHNHFAAYRREDLRHGREWFDISLVDVENFVRRNEAKEIQKYNQLDALTPHGRKRRTA